MNFILYKGDNLNINNQPQNMDKEKFLDFLQTKIGLEISNQLIILLTGVSGCGLSSTLKASFNLYSRHYEAKTICLLNASQCDAPASGEVSFSSMFGFNLNDSYDTSICRFDSLINETQVNKIRLIKTFFLEGFGKISRNNFLKFNSIMQSVHNNKEFLGGVNTIFCENVLHCELLMDSCLCASSKCIVFYMTKIHAGNVDIESLLKHNMTQEMADNINSIWGKPIL
jgi:energy-coupling factor transporter ATP-binding protein EcfA2